MNRPYKHCPHCGDPLPDGSWPKGCDGCKRPQYLNPAPVAVALQPIGDGLLTVRRGIEPKRGEFALPGGFIDLDESWQEAAVRELREETQLEVDAATVELFDVASAPDGTVLIFAKLPALPASALEAFEASTEVSELAVIDEARHLAFSLHTEMAARFFEG